ncbi:MAG: hypothetical protein GX601_05745 [Anaerolineales bacterium]|nr:hypothetical protein [Anaerolineales bacterium]
MAKPMERRLIAVEQELHITVKPVIGLIVATGVVLALAGSVGSDGSVHWALLRTSALLYVLAGLVWVCSRADLQVGAWLSVVGLAGIVILVSRWLGAPEILGLMALTTGLGAAMLGPGGALAVAVVETALLLVTRALTLGGLGTTGLVVPLGVIWSTVVLMAVVYRGVYQFHGWLEEYLQSMQSGLEEARDRRAQLEQAMQDLENANRQIALSNRRLADLRLSAEEARNAKMAFVAKVSHEFRTPLNMITGLVQLMSRSPSVYAEELPPEL